MKIGDQYYQSLWVKENDPEIIQIIDQRYLPFEIKIRNLKTPEDVSTALEDMFVRGAPLIGVAAAFGVYLAVLKHRNSRNINFKVKQAAEMIKKTRPTAVNLANAVDRMVKITEKATNIDDKIQHTFDAAQNLMREEVNACRKIGEYGIKIIKRISSNKGRDPVNILTHCNAGWLATVDYGTATAPVYLAHDKGISVHVWVDETRPRNQGSRLTAWELGQHGIPHTVITDNTGGHLMQKGMVDMVITGSDRTALNGDTANKIGTYLKALAAKDNNVPFYIALPSSSIDWTLKKGLNTIPVEQRDQAEIHYIEGLSDKNIIEKVRITPQFSPALNYGFDITPARLITALITERGICKATSKGIMKLFPDKLLS